MTKPTPIAQTIAFLRVTDLARTVRFYEQSFGLKKIYERAGKVVIFQANAGSFIGFVPGEIPQGERSGALTLIVPDADAWVRHLGDHGVPTKGAPIFKEEFGIYVIYCTDPDGYTVEVMEMRAPEWPHAAQ